MQPSRQQRGEQAASRTGRNTEAHKDRTEQARLDRIAAQGGPPHSAEGRHTALSCAAVGSSVLASAWCLAHATTLQFRGCW
jgi:hypothetical protein